MALDLSKLKKNSAPKQDTTNTSDKSFSLNFANKKTTETENPSDSASNFSLKFANKKTTEENNQPVANNSFTLTFIDKKTYDLDEMISKKRRSNSESELLLKVNLSEDVTNTIIDMVTQRILDDYRVIYNLDENSDIYYKKQVSKILSFESVFDKYFERYYNRYLEEINKSDYDGSISIDTILRNINITREDVREYTLEDVAKNESRFINLYDKNKPLVIWTDGTPDPGVDAEPSVVYVDDLYSHIGSIIEAADVSDRIIITKEDGKIHLSLENVPTLEDYINVKTKIDYLLDEVRTDKIEIAEDGSLQSIRDQIPTVGAIYDLFNEMNTYVYDRETGSTLAVPPTAYIYSTQDNNYRFRLNNSANIEELPDGSYKIIF